MLFSLFRRYLVSERQNLLQNGIRISAFGRRDRISPLVCEALSATEEATQGCRKLHLRIALDYGSRYEIVEAVRSIASEVKRRKLQLEDITEESLAQKLSEEFIPDPDLIIRTAGEQRLSNFLLWQAAYSELFFSPKLWPDFHEEDLEEALADFQSRTRKFGALACATGTAG